MPMSPPEAPRPHRGPEGWRPRAAASAAEYTNRKEARRKQRRRDGSLLELLLRGPDLLVDAGTVERIAVAGECTRPGGDRFVEATELEEHVAVMVLDD